MTEPTPGSIGNRDADERAMLDAFMAYLAGTGSMETALAALRVVVEHPVSEPEQDGDDQDPLLGLDLPALGPDEQARFDAWMRAVEQHFPDEP